MKVKIWGCRGSLPSPGPESIYFGGNTSCVEVIHKDTLIILDGGSGIRRLGFSFNPGIKSVDILLTHLHLDHIMGLGYFAPLYNPEMTITIWGPQGSSESLEKRLKRYFSPPLFPVRLKELPCKLHIREIEARKFTLGSLEITNEYVCHPGPTLGFRVESDKTVLAYIPDHEPALGAIDFPNNPDWTSGYGIAKNADLLLHDAQYKSEEYQNRIGWGHSSMADALKFGTLANVRKMLFFHHEPFHTDEQLKRLFKEAIEKHPVDFEAGLCAEDQVIHFPH
jgi:phosphoribosyl 1,2-cyclic phosphodiesterase